MYSNMSVSLVLLLSILLGLCSSSMYVLWVSLELSGMLFMFLLWLAKEEGSGLSMMKYFLVQGVSSMMLVWGIFSVSNSLLVLGGLFKLGVFPFHMWSLELSKLMSWEVWLLLMGAQKVLPFWLLMHLDWLEGGGMLLLLLNLLVSCLGSYHKSNLKELMFYSSLFNLSMMLMLSSLGSALLSLFVIYILILFSCWFVLMSIEVEYLQQLKISKNLMWMFLSLGGFPPTLGFFLKWGVFSCLIMNSISNFVLVGAMLMSLYMFYIYMSIIINSIMMSPTMLSGNVWSVKFSGVYLQCLVGLLLVMLI